MAKHESARKAARQALKRNQRNRKILGDCRSVLRQCKGALGTTVATGKGTPKGPNAAAATTKVTLSSEAKASLFADLQSTLMKAAKRGVIKRQHASRRIARMAQQLELHVTA